MSDAFPMQTEEDCDSLPMICPMPSTCEHHGLGTYPHEKWPELELFLRMTSSREGLFWDVLVQSLHMFWPAEHVRLVVVLDDESEEDHAWGAALGALIEPYQFASVRVLYEPPEPEVYNTGHDRQQWSMFWADNFTSAEYVGFVDTDTLFTTRVHPGDLFECGRPIIYGLVGAQADDWWARTASATELSLGYPQIMKGMTYFPVIMKVQHLKHLRAHIVEQMQVPDFNAAMHSIIFDHSPFSQFSIMASFMYLHHQCAYVFSLEEMQPGFREKLPGHTQCLDAVLDEKTTFPRIKVAIHYRYITPEVPVSSYLLEGYCRSEALLFTGNKMYEEQCAGFQTSTLQEALFMFEYHSWRWDNLCRHAQLKHYTAVELSERSWPNALVAEVMKEHEE